MKKLNNKGFTLVELLAVVVILAVVMGIAVTSVITAMNNSRKGALLDSAKAVANAFKTKYSESMVSGNSASIYSTEAGIGYNFNNGTTSAPVFYTLHSNLNSELNLSPSAYVLSDDAVTDATAASPTDNKITMGTSFVAFDGNSVVACLIARQDGSYYVANYASDSKTATILKGTIVTFNNAGDKTETGKKTANIMWACSQDGVNSWTN